MEIQEIVSKKENLDLTVCKHYSSNDQDPDNDWKMGPFLKLIEIYNQSSSGIANKVLYLLTFDYSTVIQSVFNSDDESCDISFDNNILLIKENRIGSGISNKSSISPSNLILLYKIDKTTDDTTIIFQLRKAVVQYFEQFDGKVENNNIIVKNKQVGAIIHTTDLNVEFISIVIIVDFKANENMYKNTLGLTNGISGIHDLFPDLDADTFKYRLKQFLEQKFGTQLIVIPTT
jgi:hypothetical protein